MGSDQPSLTSLASGQGSTSAGANPQPRVQKWEWLLLLVILLLAASLRLTRLGLVEFKYDEAVVARGALAIINGEYLPVVGPITSQGPRNLPYSQYLLALPLSLSQDIRVAAGFVALLGVAAVGLTWWVARPEFGPRVGLLAAALFAASPWAVFFSRKVWAENLPLLTLLLFACLLAWAVRHRPWALTGALVAAVGLVGFHLSGITLVAVVGVVVLLFLRKLKLAPLLVGLVLALLLVTPYLLHDASHEWANIRAFTDLAQEGGSLSQDGLRVASMVVGGYHLWDVAGTAYEEFLSGLPRLWFLDWLEAAGFWAGLAWLTLTVGWRAVRKRGRLEGEPAARLVLLCWLLIGLFLQMRRIGVSAPHRFIPLYPAQYLAIGILVEDVRKWLGQRTLARLLGVVGWIGLALLIAWQAWVFQSLMTFVNTHDTPNGYGSPLRYAQDAIRQAEEIIDSSDSAELLLLLPGGNPRQDNWASVFEVLAGPGRRLVDGRQGLIVPNGPAVYLVAPGAGQSVAVLSEAAEELGPSLPLRGGSEERYRFFSLTSEVVPSYLHSATWENGAELVGYEWEGEPHPDGTVHWVLYWRVAVQPEVGGNVHWFNHLMDGEGNRWGQLDGVGVPLSKWREGDLVIAWFDIPINSDAPLAPYFVRSGQYTYPEIVGVPLIEGGQTMGDYVELGPLEH